LVALERWGHLFEKPEKGDISETTIGGEDSKESTK